MRATPQEWADAAAKPWQVFYPFVATQVKGFIELQQLGRPIGTFTLSTDEVVNGILGAEVNPKARLRAYKALNVLADYELKDWWQPGVPKSILGGSKQIIPKRWRAPPTTLRQYETPKVELAHQSQLPPAENKFHVGNGEDGKHYWLTPPELYAELDTEFGFDFDPCPFPMPDDFDGLTCDWGQSSYVNPPFGSIMHEGTKKGPTAWVRKAIIEWQKGKRVVLVYPVDKWVLMLLKAILGEHAQVRNLGDVKWLATEDGSIGKGTGRHIACFILEPVKPQPAPEDATATPVQP